MAPCSNPKPPWLELPREITTTILFKLGTVQILTVAQKVCRLWRSLIRHSSPSMWRKIDMENLGDLYCMPYDLEEMCRDAVDRSQGQLIDINIEYFGTDELLLYISQRCRQLKRLSVAMSWYIAEETVCEAFQSFPLLEELHLMYTNIDMEAIKAVGRLCPRLKYFKLNTKVCKHPENVYDLEAPENVCDLEALAIAESMPELRHLEIIGNTLTNEGLKAILKGCLHLESLDLRLCFNVNLGGEMGTLCSQRVKHLKGPNSSLSGCKFRYINDDQDDYINMFPDKDMAIDSDYDLELLGCNGGDSDRDYDLEFLGCNGGDSDDDDDGDSDDEDGGDSSEEDDGDYDDDDDDDDSGTCDIDDCRDKFYFFKLDS